MSSIASVLNANTTEPKQKKDTLSSKHIQIKSPRSLNSRLDLSKKKKKIILLSSGLIFVGTKLKLKAL